MWLPPAASPVRSASLGADSDVKSTNCHVIAAGRGLQRGLGLAALDRFPLRGLKKTLAHSASGGKVNDRFYSKYVPPPADIPNRAKVRTVFLDRDGVINEKAREGEYICSTSELHLLPGVPESIARLNRAGLRTIVVSNQRGIAKGLYTAEAVNGIHEAIQETLRKHGARLDAFFICPHDKDQCHCRKPLPGMFEQAVTAFPGVKADESVMIGDSFVDIEFGRRLGMPTILIEGDPARHKPDLVEAIRLADWRVSSLPGAVDLVLGRRADAPCGMIPCE
jgi:D-glycero-D-manno-heptose 1,7-bisphosphate phosphatase